MEAPPHLGLLHHCKSSRITPLKRVHALTVLCVSVCEQDGWKTIFKASILILQQFEEQLLDLSFEMMLSQMPNLQQKFFICPLPNASTATSVEKAAWQREQCRELDKAFTVTKIPTILLERLKREFDEVEAS